MHQSSQTSNKSICNNFSYSINSTEDAITFQLAAEETYLSVITEGGVNYLSVTVHLKDCPAGFLLSNVTSSCECDPVLGINKIYCNIDDQTILRPANSWIGFIDELNNTGALFHPNCPIKFCLPRDVKITINTSDGQCKPHRTGLLCGKCEEGYSLTLGDQKCEKCSHLLAPHSSICSGRAIIGGDSVCSGLDCDRGQHQWPCYSNEWHYTVFRGIQLSLHSWLG